MLEDVSDPETDVARCLSTGVLGNTFRWTRPEEALPVLEACLALKRRYWSHDEQGILVAQIALANCLANIGRHDEALLLKREVYARWVATFGVSHERTILSGTCLAASLLELELWDEAKTFVSDPPLPVARRSLGADHDTTLLLNEYLARALKQKPE